MRKQVKIAAFAALLAVGFTANAQITDVTSSDLNKNTGRKAGGTADDEKSIRLIDNKGTIKYLQAKNGLTQITSTAPGNKTVTTWQLGGVLNNNTYIEASSGKEFALDGLELITGLMTQADFDAAVALDGRFDTPENRAKVISSNATDRSIASNTTTPPTGYGFTVLVRDEVTGATKKASLSELLQVEADHKVVPVTAANLASGAADLFNAATAIELAFKYPNTTLASFSKVQVYRNGAKLRANEDYTLDNSGTNTKVVLVDKSDVANEPYDWTLYEQDIIEVHAIK